MINKHKKNLIDLYGRLRYIQKDASQEEFEIIENIIDGIQETFYELMAMEEL